MTETRQLREPKKKSRGKIIVKRILQVMWILFFVGILSLVGLFWGISNGKIGYMPPIEDLENPIDKYASQLYSSDGQQLGTYSQDKHNRIYSNYSDLPPYLVQALVATEDVRYYEHSGVDAYALARAIIKTGLLRQKQSGGGGGSTISQQLAKQLYSPKTETVIDRILQKPIEWVIAVKLEKYYTKDEIVNLYFNQFDFLYHAVGIRSAAQVYFNKKPQDLTLEEAATLVGMCKNPAYYNPKRYPDRTKGRRNVVLEQMAKYNYIDKATFESAKKKDLVLDFQRIDHVDGLAPYFREYIRVTLSAKEPKRANYAAWQTEQYITDSIQWAQDPMYGWCNKNTKPDGTPYKLGTDGLRIYATLDSRMQTYAENAVSKHMSEVVQPTFENEKRGKDYAPYSYKNRNNIDKILERAMKNTDRYRVAMRKGVPEAKIMKSFKEPVDMKVFSWKGEVDTTMTPLDSIRYLKGMMRAGFMAMDTETGYVRAYVGSIDYRYFKYDMVNKARRQVGSVIKPFLYALSMEEGITPCDTMYHVQQVLKAESGKDWIPRNANQKHIGEYVTIKWGLQNSDNWVTAYLMSRTSPYTFKRMLQSFGITGEIDPVVSMCLGTPEVSIAEMAGAYTAFANKGIRANPIYVTRIEDANGNVIANFAPRVNEVISEQSYVSMLDMLRSVVDGGTGGRLRRIYKLQGELGGKTGTTQSNSDGWFMGLTPRLAAASWVGGEEPIIHFDRMANGQGAVTALPIYGLFLKAVYDDPTIEYGPEDTFERIKGLDPCKKNKDKDVVEDYIGVSGPVKIDDVFN